MRTTFDLKKYTHTNNLLGGSEKKRTDSAYRYARAAL